MSRRAVLISVAQEFAEKIAAGTKTVELRRRFPNVPDGTWVYIYVTLPVGAILGRARVGEIHAAKPSALWDQHRNEVGISRSRFMSYFSGSEAGYAVQLIGYESLQPVHLATLRTLMDGFVVPQSYRFLSEHDEATVCGHAPALQAMSVAC